jgi:uncharacterized protein YjbI with pentapeptide repeats
MRAGYRRALLLAAAAALFGTAVSQADTGPVFVANAGVLGSMVNGLKTPFPALTNMTGGSVALAQSIESGALTPDIFGSADASVNNFLLGDANNNKERWFAAFARNAIVMLVNASLAGANLNNANLTGALLKGADLSGANLQGANLTDADLSGAALAGANLHRANLTDADLSGADVSGANLNGARFSNTTCPDGTNSDADGGRCST